MPSINTSEHQNALIAIAMNAQIRIKPPMQKASYMPVENLLSWVSGD
ncbi:MAG: hypothetical protein P2A85_00600 [Microcoleus anatoxicus]